MAGVRRHAGGLSRGLPAAALVAGAGRVVRVRLADLLAPAPGEVPGRPWDRIPALVSAALVFIPAAAVPAMGCYVIATGGHGLGWDLIAGFLALVGTVGLAAILAGVVAAIRRVRSPIPLLLMAAGTTVALVAGLLMTPVMMAAVGLGG